MLTGSSGDLEFMVLYSIFFLIPMTLFCLFVALLIKICERFDDDDKDD